MGQVLLLARRLIEAGVRFVTANAVSHPPNTKLSSFQIWDTHFDHFRLYDSHLMPELDQALSALLADLADRGYAGWVGLEYKPTTDTETSLAWLPRQRRAARGQDPR